MTTSVSGHGTGQGGMGLTARIFGVSRCRTLALAALGLALGLAPAVAEPIGDLLPALLTSNNKVLAAKADLEAARQRVNVAWGGWYPNLSLTSWVGRQSIHPNQETGTPRTGASAHETDVSLSQLLYDFGKTNSQIDLAAIALALSDLQAATVEQTLLLDAVSSYVDLIKSREVVSYSRQSEDNIRHQTGLEEARVDQGAGYTTDVLQAKTQLAGAEAQRLLAEGAQANAVSHFKAVYLRDPGPAAGFRRPSTPADLLPRTVEDAVRIALTENPQVQSARTTVRLAEEGMHNTTLSALAPDLKVVAEAKDKSDVDGQFGRRREYVGKVQLSWPLGFNLGLTARNSMLASESGVAAAVAREADARVSVEEQVRKAWQSLATATTVARVQRNQANIAGEFLALARQERQLGLRSLIDVLSGETALINAKSAAASAESDVVTAAAGLLAAIGRLNVETVTRMSQEAPPPPPATTRKR